jgi:ATP-dependent DNA helicase RecQ
METPASILEKYWGFTSFIDPQEKIINHVIDGHDTIALLPTSGGKSICFQIPALLKEGTCIVISPLISLMNDQVNNLKKRNIKAIALTSQLSEDEIVNAFDNLQFGNYKFLYLSPEKIQSEFIQEKIKQLNVQLIAIDEAHCISEWGHDFRPSFLNINILRTIHPKAPIIALTASATEKVVEDIITNLNLESPKIVKKSFFRSNLAYQIFEVEDKLYKIEQIIKKIKGAKIIYTNSRRQTVELSNQLNSLNYQSTFFHGGMNYVDKMKSYDEWLEDKKPIIVATNPFGMGIDKPNVKAVIHVNIPLSIENYMQEAGRAGRDGKKAFSVVLKNKADVYDTQMLTKKTLPKIEFVKSVYIHLNHYYQISYGELLDKIYDFNLTDFCNHYKIPIVKTHNAIKVLDREHIISLNESFYRKSKLKFIVSNNEIFTYMDSNPSEKDLITLLLRTYGGVFDAFKTINENYISTQLKISLKEIISSLRLFHSHQLVSYHGSNNNTQIKFLVPREDNITINHISRNVIKRNELKLFKVNRLIEFIEDVTICRSKQLLAYFNESDTSNCEICDVCISNKNKNTSTEDLSKEIIDLLHNCNSISSKEIISHFKQPKDKVLFNLQLLLEKNILTVTSHNKYKINKIE